MSIKPKKLVKSGHNTVVNYKGENVPAAREDLSVYFENEITFQNPLTSEFGAALGALFVEASAEPMTAAGYVADGNTTPKGTIRGNERLQNAIEALATKFKVSYETLVDLLKSSVAGMEGAKAPFNYELELEQLVTEFDNVIKTTVQPLIDAKMPDAVIESVRNMAEEAHAKALKALEQRRKQSETAQSKKANK